MKRTETVVMLLIVAMLSSSAMAQNTAAKTKAPPSVLTQIPANAMAFAVIPNVKKSATAIDKFMADIGMGMRVPPILTLLNKKAKLGPGFNPNSGAAIAMLDPEQFGLDLVALIDPKGGVEPKEPKPGDIPVVFWVAGSGVEEVFGALLGDKLKKAGKFHEAMIEGEKVYFIHHNGYVVGGPSKRALEAVLNVKKSVNTTLPKAPAAAIAKSNAAFHVNMKIAGPVIVALIKKAEEEMAGDLAGEEVPLAAFRSMFVVYRTMIDQLDSMTATGRIDDDGVVFDAMVSFVSDSNMAKATAAMKKSPQASMTSLANLPYVFAASSIAQTDMQSRALALKTTNDMMGLLGDKVTIVQKAKLAKIYVTVLSQLTEMKFVMGGGPAEGGLFGEAFVMKCKDSAKLKSAIAELVPLFGELLRNIDPTNKEIQKLKISYVKNLEKAGDVSVDAITIDFPELTNMDENNREMMKKVLGEDKLRALIAAPDKNTVILTFGGSTAFMSQSIKADKSGAKLMSADQTKALPKHTPEHTAGLCLINIPNLLEVAIKGANTMMPGMGNQIPVRFITKEPIVMASGVTGDSGHMTVFVPTKLIQEVAQIAIMMGGMMGGGMGPAGPPPGGF